MTTKIEQVSKNNTSGSWALSRAGLEALDDCVAEYPGDPLDEFIEQLNNASRTMIKAHPMQVLLRKRNTAIVNYAKRIAKNEANPENLRGMVRAKIKELITKSEEDLHKIGSNGCRLIARGNNVLTLSSSVLVREILLHAHQQKRKFDVYCLESRPMNEGVKFAEELASHGLTVHLIPDAAIGFFMQTMNLVITGADRLCDTTFINKIGTLPTALVANSFRVPFYIACETEKVMSEIERVVRFNPADPKEVYPKKLANLTAENYYFEAIPYEYVSKVVCEEGVYEILEFIRWYIKE
jgi:translation initiation factor 2B subunit (eIF-2B alpha/beta/delta family)